MPDLEAVFIDPETRLRHGWRYALPLDRPVRLGRDPEQADWVMEHDGRISGYASDLGFTGHAVGESDADIEALILAADAFHGSGILVPITNGELFRWCLEHGLHVVHTMTLMTIGLYTTPRGAYLPSVQF